MQKAIVLIAIVLFASGCVTQRRCNEKFPPTVEIISFDSTVNNSFLQKTSKDSVFVYLRDSVFIKVKGDTVFHSVFKTLYRDRIKYDTVVRTDSVFVIRKNDKTEVEKVNELTPLQKLQINLFWIFSIITTAILFYKISKIIK